MKRAKRKAAPTPAAPQREFEWRAFSSYAWIGAVVLLALCAYSSSYRAPFLLDNHETILEDTRVHANTAENLDRIFGGPYYQAILAGLYRPVTTWTYLFNYAMLGDGADPAGYHRFNFWAHAANMALVFALGRILFQDRFAAFALSALWGVHPVQTESVTNIVGRADMLAAFGVLGALVCYHWSLRMEGPRRAAALAGVALAAGIGVGSKESAVVVIGVIALYDVAFARAPWKARIAGYAAAAAPLAVFLLARARVLGRFPAGPFPFTDNPLVGAPFWAARLTAVKVIGRYLGLLVWPARLSADYSYNEIPVAIDVKAIAACVVCVAAVGLGIRAWRRHRELSFAILFFFVTLAPVSNVFLLIGSIMGERFLYLPSVGFFAAVVFGARLAWERAPRLRRPLAAALAIVLVALAVRAYARNLDWLEERRFWRSAVEAAPGSYRARISEAAATPVDRRADRERVAAEVAGVLATLDPLPDSRNTAVPYRNAGVIYRNLGDELTLNRAEPDGTEPAFWYQKSLNALIRSERIERELNHTYQEVNARRGTPQETFLPAVVYLEAGRTMLRLRQQKEALATFEMGRRLESNPDLLEEMGATYEAFGQWRLAAQTYVEALEVDSNRTRIQEKLVELYGKADPSGCAVNRKGGAPALDLSCPMVHADICGAARNVATNYLRRNQKMYAESIRRTAAVDLGCADELLK